MQLEGLDSFCLTVVLANTDSSVWILGLLRLCTSNSAVLWYLAFQLRDAS